MPGGRVRYSENLTAPPDQTWLRGQWESGAAPGLLAACPPSAGASECRHVRGSSYAAALATRAAAQALDVIDALRSGRPEVIPADYEAVLLKALLVHGADWSNLFDEISAHAGETSPVARKRLVARYVGYGWSNVQKAVTCTEQRATLLGFGSLLNEKALEFRVPVPMSLHALPRRRRLTVTLAWLTPVHPRHSKYRVARLWVDPPVDALGLRRSDGDWQHVRAGTVQHEVLVGDAAVPLVEGDELVFTVNCKADAGRLSSAAKFALCATLEVAEELNLPIYREIREGISPRAEVRAPTG